MSDDYVFGWDNYSPMEVSTPTCVVCGKDSLLEVDFTGYLVWAAREAPGRVALPDLSEEELRLLETGIHEHCWVVNAKRIAEALGMDDE
ncbi:MAG TPA: hypothetical protein VIG24_10960 [Acidimicrobiia bacterium]